MGEEKLIIQEGSVLITLSNIPMGYIRNKKRDTVWAPQITVIRPTGKAKLIYNGNSITKKGVNAFVNKADESGETTWYNQKEYTKDVMFTQYIFKPGIKKELEDRTIYTITNGFVPDEKGPSQNKEPVCLVTDKGLGYILNQSIGFVSLTKEFQHGVYMIVRSLNNRTCFHYDCENSGERGLSSTLHGKLILSSEEEREIAKAIVNNFKPGHLLNRYQQTI